MSPAEAAAIRRKHQPVPVGEPLTLHLACRACRHAEQSLPAGWPCGHRLAADREHPTRVVVDQPEWGLPRVLLFAGFGAAAVLALLYLVLYTGLGEWAACLLIPAGVLGLLRLARKANAL